MFHGASQREPILYCSETMPSDSDEGEVHTTVKADSTNEVERTTESVQRGDDFVLFPVFHAERDTVECLREIEQSLRDRKSFTGQYRGGVSGIFRTKANISNPLTLIACDDDWRSHTMYTNCYDELPDFDNEIDYNSILGYYQTYSSIGVVIRTLPDTNIKTIDLVKALEVIQDPFVLVLEVSKEGVWHWHMIWFTSRRCDNAKRTLLNVLKDLRISISTQQTKSFKHLLKYILKEPRFVFTHKDAQLLRLVGYILNNERESVDESKVIDFPNVIVKDIIAAMKHTNKYTFEELLNYAPEVMSKYLHKPNIEAIINNCKLFLLRPNDISVTYERILNSKRPETNFFIIWAFLDFQGINPMDFLLDLAAVMFHIPEKKNTIVIQGKSNTGKTTFIRHLLNLFNWGEIQSSGQFMFQNCINKELMIWEEPLIGSDFVENCKRVFEGMNTQVSVKYRAAQTLYRTPIIITTNKDLWHYCTQDEVALRNRVFLYFFNRTASEFSYEWLDDNYERNRTNYRECIERLSLIITNYCQIRGDSCESCESTDTGTDDYGSEFDGTSDERRSAEHLHRYYHIDGCKGILERWDNYRRGSSSERTNEYSPDTPGPSGNNSATADDNGSGSDNSTGDTTGGRSNTSPRCHADRGHKRRRSPNRQRRNRRRHRAHDSRVLSTRRAHYDKLHSEQFGSGGVQEIPKNTTWCPQHYVDWEVNSLARGYGRDIKEIHWYTFFSYFWALHKTVVKHADG
nr:MAG: nonstructural protein [Army ant associated chapparvovirus 5]